MLKACCKISWIYHLSWSSSHGAFKIGTTITLHCIDKNSSFKKGRLVVNVVKNALSRTYCRLRLILRLWAAQRTEVFGSSLVHAFVWISKQRPNPVYVLHTIGVSKNVPPPNGAAVRTFRFLVPTILRMEPPFYVYNTCLALVPSRPSPLRPLPLSSYMRF